MAKFKVHLQQYVERVATVDVEAEDEGAAIAAAKIEAMKAKWQDGEDAYTVDAYAVCDASGNIIER